LNNNSVVSKRIFTGRLSGAQAERLEPTEMLSLLREAVSAGFLSKNRESHQRCIQAILKSR
jgi:hypothetical protein